MTRTYDPTRGGTKIPASSSLAVLVSWIGNRGDYAGIEQRDKAVKGWRRYVHPVTLEGRFTFVVATWLSIAVAGGVYMWKRKSAANKEKQDK